MHFSAVGGVLVKIGAFAALHHVSIDTVRHYIDLGLLLPEKCGSQFSFDDRCGSDLDEIHSLKTMGFTLAEIHTIFMFLKLGRMTSYKEDISFHELFISKYSRISELLKELKQISSRLEGKIREFEGRREEKQLTLGIQLQNLRILQCPCCKAGLNLRKAQIEDNQVIDGILDCGCGMEYPVMDGILINKADMEIRGEGAVNDKYSPDTTSGETKQPQENNWISEYIKNTDEAYLSKVYKSLEWAYRRLDFAELGGRVMLELGSGRGFFLRHIYEDLPESTLYIAVDHDIDMQRYLKQMLENAGVRRNILFICSDFLKLPICDRMADIVVDIAGASNYSMEHEEFLLKPVSRYFSENAVLLGSYILFGNFSSGSRIPISFRKNFRAETIRKEIKLLGFKIINELITEYLNKGGVYEDYFTEGERVNSCLIHAKRSCLHEV